MSQNVYEIRREQVFARMPNNSAAILFANAAQYRNRDTEFTFRQDSYFYYLTGFNERNAIALLIKRADKPEYIIFCQARDPISEQWNGPILGCDAAPLLLGATAAFAITQAELEIPKMIHGITRLYMLMKQTSASRVAMLMCKENFDRRAYDEQPTEYFDLAIILDEMRLIKSPVEEASLQKACDISVRAHELAMLGVAPGMYEYELEAILLKAFYERGSRSPAYPSIVAAGANACVLHYTQNTAVLRPGDLVLIDAGAEYDCLAADITRTFPVSGKFTRPQQAIYELVLAAQTAAIAAIKPGVAWNSLQKIILEVLVAGLVDLKILKGDAKELIERKAYLPFYMHNSGHWLGMDVHDVGRYKVDEQSRALQPGMVLTVEPGLYIGANDQTVDEQWRGIGVRIEDDIIVRPTGATILTDALGRSVQAIEQLMARRH